MHNQAILRHYASTSEDFDLDKIVYFYGEALQAAIDDEYRAFSARHFALLFIDLQQPEKASRILGIANRLRLSPIAKTEIRYALCQAWLQQLTVPYDQKLLSDLRNMLKVVVQEYEEQKRNLSIAMVLTDAGIVANYDESWSESLGYFNKAISIFESENLPELAANVQYRKGTLLFTWSKNGNPQFYRPAAEAFQLAARIFSRESAPEQHADIQHHLGMIYAEMPDEEKKKSIWAAMSASAFQEALNLYNKDTFPYEYATVCNHYGNALTNFPEAKMSDNIMKAISFYEEALTIRTAEEFPMERSLTLLNYLEAQWHLAMPEDIFDEKRYQNMLEKAQEVKTLSVDPKITAEAEQHLERLSQLKNRLQLFITMHEISLVRNIFSTLESEFPKNELDRMIRIDLQVGLLANVEPILMQNAFEAVTTAEEKYQEVKLNIELVPIEIYCKECEIHSKIENYKFACTSCGKPNNNVVKGTELLIQRVEFDSD